MLRIVSQNQNFYEEHPIFSLSVLFVSFIFVLAFMFVLFILIEHKIRLKRNSGGTTSQNKAQLKIIENLPVAQIGYKFADIHPKGFMGLSKGKPYGANSKVSEKAMGFHSYKTLDLLYSNIEDYRQGGLVLEVLHYGEVTEYEEGWVSTGQRVLQVSPNLFAGCEFDCDDQSEFVVSWFKKRFNLCRPHYASTKRLLLFFLPFHHVYRTGKWLEDLRQSGDFEKVNVVASGAFKATPHKTSTSSDATVVM